MKWRGYEIVTVPHEIPGWPKGTSIAVIGPDGRPRKVISNDVAHHVIDMFVDRGDWPDREAGEEPVGK